jgi:tetratricopeptide (TPR) repeat protein
MDPEELAETYILLGEFFLSEEDYENAMTSFNNAANIYTDIDPLGVNAMEAELYLAEAEIYSNEPNAVSGVLGLIDELLDNLEYNLEEYNYAGEIGEYDIQNDYCYELVNTNDLLGWAYDLIDNEAAADEYYRYAESYPCQD